MKGFTEALITDLQAQRAAHQVLGGDARPHRHRDRHQFAQGAERRRIRHPRAPRPWPRRASGMAARWAWRPDQITDDEIRALMRRAAAAASATTRRPPPPRPPRSSSTASRPSAGASWSATTPSGMDELVRADPEHAYEPGLLPTLAERARLADRGVIRPTLLSPSMGELLPPRWGKGRGWGCVLALAEGNPFGADLASSCEVEETPPSQPFPHRGEGLTLLRGKGTSVGRTTGERLYPSSSG